MTRILALSGSSRRGSLNQNLLDQAALGARAAGAEVTSIRLSDFELPARRPPGPVDRNTGTQWGLHSAA
jgi:NAD(P)H-dependent FMN reductase